MIGHVQIMDLNERRKMRHKLILNKSQGDSNELS